jgi:DNA recombination protein RmuC
MQEILPYLVIFLIILVVIVLINSRKSTDSNSSEREAILINQLNHLSTELNQKLGQTNDIINRQLNSSSAQLQNQNTSNNQLLQQINENNSKILRELTEKMMKVEDTNKQVVNFAEQLQSIQNIFKNPKQRGIIGEYFLETILDNVLPQGVYKIQYKYKNDTIVDAIILVRDKIIPIDAKFSTDSYNRIITAVTPDEKSRAEKEFVNDVKRRIDETSKYVSNEENTIDIAFMFVPSDAIYNEIIAISESKSIPVNIVTYAYSKKVVLVSPTSFFAYLQTVLLALNTIQMEGRVDEVIQYLNESTNYLREFEDSVNKLGKNLGTTVNAFNNVSVKSTKLSKRLSKVTGNKKNLIDIAKVEKIGTQVEEETDELVLVVEEEEMI